MSEVAEVERLPVSDLMSRYGISKSVLYERIKALNIERTTVGRKAYVSGEQIAIMDGLHDFLQTGRSTAEFLELSGIQSGGQSAKKQSAEQSGSLTFPAESASQLLNLMVEQSAPEPVQSSLHWTERLRFLEEACQNSWLLSTSQLAEMIGLSPVTLARMQDCDRYGFQFSRKGMNGSELAWEIKKKG